MNTTVVPEKTEQANIIQLLRTLRFDVYVLGHPRRAGDYPGTMQTPGLPDLLAFSPMRAQALRRLLFVEAKREGGRLRPEQAYFGDLALSCGAQVHYVFGTLDKVLAWCVRFGYLKKAA